MQHGILSKAITPFVYNLHIVPDLDEFTFQSYLELRCEILTATTKITLHSLDLYYKPNNISIQPIFMGKPFGQEKIKCISFDQDSKQQQVSFSFKSLLTPGFYLLRILYQGVLNDQLCGFYRSSYQKPDNTLSWIAVTQFEATDARRAFPCIDEPNVKAQFQVSIITHIHFVALSNTPVSHKSITMDYSEQADYRGLLYPSDWIEYTFEITPIMSTYLVAFVVGQLECVSRQSKDQIKVSVYTPLGKTDLVKFALDTAVTCLDFYNEYFGIPYPLTKLDMVAVPDFSAGAMENWGLVTYREPRLLIDEKCASFNQKLNCAMTVCHELAHMWFGNFVTMDFWTQLWLNEGFATFMQYLAVDHLFPQWNVWTQFVDNCLTTAQDLDALKSSHPVEVEVHHPDEINEIFDTISYNKGASVLRMLYEWIGGDQWKRGIQMYMKKHLYGNTKTDDLWQCLSTASSIDISKLMNQWINVTGYPVLHIEEELTSSTNQTRRFHLQQKRFMDQGISSEEQKCWSFILHVRGSTGVVTAVAINDIEHHFDVSLPPGPVLFNSGQSGFFKIAVSRELFQDMLPTIPQLSSVDRLGFMYNTYSLAIHGAIPVSFFLQLWTHYKQETDRCVFVSFTYYLSSLLELHQRQPYYDQELMSMFIETIYLPHFWRLHMFIDSNSEQDLEHGIEARLSLAVVICILGEMANTKTVVRNCTDLINKFIQDQKQNDIPVDLRNAVYRVAIKWGGVDIQSKMLQLYRSFQHSQTEQQRILQFIGRMDSDTPNVGDLIEQLLIFIFDSNEVRSNMIDCAIKSCCQSTIGQRCVWKYLQTHWDTIIQKYAQGQNFILAGIIGSVLKGGDQPSEKFIEEYTEWFESHPVPSAKREIEQATEIVRLQCIRLQREKTDIEKWSKSWLEVSK